MRRLFFAVIVGGLLVTGIASFLKYQPDAPFPFSLPFRGNAERNLVPLEGSRIVFDSNRSGTFGIYTIDPGAGDIRVLADSKDHEMYPSPNPQGTLIAYARTMDLKELQSQIWLMNRDGSHQRLLVKKGTFPSFSADGKTVYFERAKRKVMAVSLDGTNVRKVFPPADSEFKGHLIVKPRVSEDGRYVAFASNKPAYWNAWLAPIAGGEATHINHGCEPSWIPNSNNLVWVKRHEAKALAGIYQYETSSGTKHVLEDREDPFGHEYFPELSQPGGILLFAACPGNEHHHTIANYQLFAKIGNKERIRLTHDGFTNRWPKILPEPGAIADSG